jgi:hypothetical protein
VLLIFFCMATLWDQGLATAIARNRAMAMSRYASLSCLNAAGHPTVRTVQYLGRLNELAQLQQPPPAPGADDLGPLVFRTDLRTEKAAGIAADPRVELSWYRFE